MPIRQEILCISKTNSIQYFERISHIGGPGWRYTEKQAIALLKIGTYEFYMKKDGQRVKLIIGTCKEKPYLKTELDDLSPDCLLTLADCAY
jgi:hypothetical protein